MTKRKNLILVSLLLLSLIGFVDSLFIHVKSVENYPISCFVIEGCDLVLYSSYATLFGVHLPWFGMAFYFLLFLITALYLGRSKKYLINLLIILVSVGVLFSLYLIYLQAFVINNFCSYCLLSLLDVLISLLLVVMLKNRIPVTF
ncbi:MAG: vitamin K epoxide reductase family protein [Candidatus Paceibacterota bacterium]